MAEYEMKVPLREEDVRRLRIKDVVYLSGEVFTVRDSAYERILGLLAAKKELPFELKNKAIWHAGPITRQEEGKWKPVSVGSTTSSRFTGPASLLIEKAGVKMVIGKGFMGPEASRAFQKHGAAYTVTTGGAAAYYAMQIPEVLGVHWLDLGMPAAVWVMRVKRLGPLIVAMDSHEENIFTELQAKVDSRLERIYREHQIDPKHKYLWWP